MLALRIGRCLLPQLIQRRGLTQAELAKRAEMSESTISHYANNRRVMSLENAKTLAEVLSVNIDDLYEWHGSLRFRGRE